jgi:hypothetical protein
MDVRSHSSEMSHNVSLFRCITYGCSFAKSCSMSHNVSLFMQSTYGLFLSQLMIYLLQLQLTAHGKLDLAAQTVRPPVAARVLSHGSRM